MTDYWLLITGHWSLITAPNNGEVTRSVLRSLGRGGHDHHFGHQPPLTPPNTRGGTGNSASIEAIGAQFKVPPLVLGGVRAFRGRFLFYKTTEGYPSVFHKALWVRRLRTKVDS